MPRIYCCLTSFRVTELFCPGLDGGCAKFVGLATLFTNAYVDDSLVWSHLPDRACKPVSLFSILLTGVPSLSSGKAEVDDVVALIRLAKLPEHAVIMDRGSGWPSGALRRVTRLNSFNFV
jgi:hypothetical protein